MIHTREKSQKKQYVREITDTSSLAKKAELITLKQTIRNLALDIEDLQAKWNSHYELSLISTDTDIIGLSDSEKLKMRKEQEYRLKEKAKQIEKNYAQLRDHLNASKAVTDEAEKITTDLNHMFGGMLSLIHIWKPILLFLTLNSLPPSHRYSGADKSPDSVTALSLSLIHI